MVTYKWEFTFGKYKDPPRTLEWVCEHDPSYIFWAEANIDWFCEELGELKEKNPAEYSLIQEARLYQKRRSSQRRAFNALAEQIFVRGVDIPLGAIREAAQAAVDEGTAEMLEEGDFDG